MTTETKQSEVFDLQVLLLTAFTLELTEPDLTEPAVNELAEFYPFDLIGHGKIH